MDAVGWGGRVVKFLACGARGPGFDSRPRHWNFQRLVISCFQVAILLKYRWSDINPHYNQPTNHGCCMGDPCTSSCWWHVILGILSLKMLNVVIFKHNSKNYLNMEISQGVLGYYTLVSQTFSISLLHDLYVPVCSIPDNLTQIKDVRSFSAKKWNAST